MEKFLRIFCFIFTALMASNVNAADVTDELTLSSFGVTGTNYKEVTNIKATSDAVYYGQMAGDHSSIQLRSKNSNSGIVTTTSGGKVKSIKIEWNSNTNAARELDVYGKNSAYTAATELYGSDQGDKIASFLMSEGNKETTITGDYEYIGFRSKSGAMYIDKITIVWEVNSSDTRENTTIEFSGNYPTKFSYGPDGESAALPTATVNAGDTEVSGASVTWSLEKTSWHARNAGDEPTLNTTTGVVSIPNGCYGVLKLTATYEGNTTYKGSSKNYTLTVYKAIQSLKELVSEYQGVESKEEELKSSTGVLVSYWQVHEDSGIGIVCDESLVTYVNGVYTYITDGTYSTLLYGSNLGFAQGDKITGDHGSGDFGPIYGNLKLYNGLFEFNVTENQFVKASSGNAVSPTVITPSQLSDNMNVYVQIKNAEYTTAFTNRNATFTADATAFTVRQNWTNVNVEGLEVGKVYDLVGTVANYNGTYQLYLASFTESSSATGIDSMDSETEATTDSEAYNLAGQRVDKNFKGIVVMNGKKLLKK